MGEGRGVEEGGGEGGRGRERRGREGGEGGRVLELELENLILQGS